MILVNEVPSTFVKQAYENTRETSPLRRLVVAIFVRCGEPSWLQEPYNSDLTTDFLTDVAVALYSKDGSKNGLAQFQAIRDDYHVAIPT